MIPAAKSPTKDKGARRDIADAHHKLAVDNGNDENQRNVQDR